MEIAVGPFTLRIGVNFTNILRAAIEQVDLCCSFCLSNGAVKTSYMPQVTAFF